jgi:hypothetical protein
MDLKADYDDGLTASIVLCISDRLCMPRFLILGSASGNLMAGARLHSMGRACRGDHPAALLDHGGAFSRAHMEFGRTGPCAKYTAS